MVAKSFELGASGSHERGLWTIDWLFAGYRTSNVNDIQFVASDIRGRAFFRNIGQTRRQGFEATVKAVVGRWQLSASYSFIDATYRSPVTFSSPSNPEADEGLYVPMALAVTFPFNLTLGMPIYWMIIQSA